MEQSLSSLILTAGGVAGGLISIYKLGQILKPYVKRIFDSMFGTRKLLEQLNKRLEEIQKEVRPNGGSSMRDVINRVEAMILIQDQRQRAMVADAEHGIFEADASGRCTHVNRTYCRLVGRTPQELLGYGWINSVAAEDRERVDREWAQAIAEEREFESEYTAVTPDGEEKRVIARSVKMSDMNGRAIGYFGTVKPVQ